MKDLSGKILVMIVMFLVVGCSQQPVAEDRQPEVDPAESLIKANKYLVKSEKEDIENYIVRHNLDMLETGSGLRYMVYEIGSGPELQKGQVVEINYQLKLITGDVVYTSDENGPMVFEIGHGRIETGLEEAMMYLSKGDKAKLIIPSHLAYGLQGDNKKIPPRSTLIYDIEIIN